MPLPRHLLREHFRGCALVLVAGGDDAAVLHDVPRLEPDDGGYAVVAGAVRRAWDADALAGRLRRPRPWD